VISFVAYIVQQVAPAYVELHVLWILLVQPKARSIEMHFKSMATLFQHVREFPKHARTNVHGVYAVVLHTVFMEGKCVGKILAARFFCLPEMGLQG